MISTRKKFDFWSESFNQPPIDPKKYDILKISQAVSKHPSNHLEPYQHGNRRPSIKMCVSKLVTFNSGKQPNYLSVDAKEIPRQGRSLGDVFESLGKRRASLADPKSSSPDRSDQRRKSLKGVATMALMASSSRSSRRGSSLPNELLAFDRRTSSSFERRRRGTVQYMRRSDTAGGRQSLLSPIGTGPEKDEKVSYKNNDKPY